MALQTYKAQISVAVDTGLPQDAMVVTPHFSDTLGPVNPDTTAQALATNTLAYLGVAAYVTVKIYEETDSAHNYPLSTKTAGTAGAILVSSAPREVALCLSYYAVYNRPRFRGRLYIPWSWIAKHIGGTPTTGMRPTTAQMDAVNDFANTVLKPLKTAGTAHWTVWSTVNKTHADVTNYYCDDEWDIQRRRGLKPTARRAASF